MFFSVRLVGSTWSFGFFIHLVCYIIIVPYLLLQYREYEQVVVEDRIDKEKTRRKQEQEAIELKASIKVCSLVHNN